MRSTRVVTPLVFAVGFTTALYIALGLFGPTRWVFRMEIAEAETFVQKIEEFRNRHRRVPTDVEAEEIRAALGWGATPEGCPCYRRDSMHSYIIWIQGRTLGDSVVYHSTTLAWEERG